MDNEKGQAPQNHVEFGTIILRNFCNVTAIVKVVARCFWHLSLIYLSCLNNDLFGSVQHQKELHSMVSTWETRVSINTKQFLLSSRTHVDLADQEDAVCEEVYSFGLAKNGTALLQIYFLPTFTCTSGCACRSSGHLALPRVFPSVFLQYRASKDLWLSSLSRIAKLKQQYSTCGSIYGNDLRAAVSILPFQFRSATFNPKFCLI